MNTRPQDFPVSSLDATAGPQTGAPETTGFPCANLTVPFANSKPQKGLVAFSRSPGPLTRQDTTPPPPPREQGVPAYDVHLGTRFPTLSIAQSPSRPLEPPNACGSVVLQTPTSRRWTLESSKKSVLPCYGLQLSTLDFPNTPCSVKFGWLQPPALAGSLRNARPGKFCRVVSLRPPPRHSKTNRRCYKTRKRRRYYFFESGAVSRAGQDAQPQLPPGLWPNQDETSVRPTYKAHPATIRRAIAVCILGASPTEPGRHVINRERSGIRQHSHVPKSKKRPANRSSLAANNRQRRAALATQGKEHHQRERHRDREQPGSIRPLRSAQPAAQTVR